MPPVADSWEHAVGNTALRQRPCLPHPLPAPAPRLELEPAVSEDRDVQAPKTPPAWKNMSVGFQIHSVACVAVAFHHWTGSTSG